MKKKISKKFRIKALACVLCLAIVASISWALFHPTSTDAAWFDDNWAYRKSIVLPNHTAIENNVYVTLTIDTATLITANKMQTDCGDLRFTKLNGELLEYYISSGCNSSTTSININFDVYPAGSVTIYQYYGNPTASNGFSTTNFTTSASNNGQNLNLQVNANSGDAQQSDGSTTVTISPSTSFTIGTGTAANSPDQHDGFRFTGGPAQGSGISTATIQLRKRTAQWQQVTWSFYGEASDSCNAYSDGAGDPISSRPKTTASLAVSENISRADGEWISWNITNIVQEIVNRSGYSNNICIMAVGDGPSNFARYNIFDYGTNSANAAKLDIISSGITPSSVGSEEKGPGPILYWKFDEGTGTTANDSTSSNNYGTLNGPSIQSEENCYLGKCLRFDGINDYVSRAYSSDTELDPSSNSFSVSAWIKHTSTISGTDTILARSNGAVNGIGYKLYMNSSGYICFGIDDDATSFPEDSACSAASYADSRWHFIEAVKSGTSSITLYVDGKQVAQDTSISATGSLSGTSPTLYVGIDGDGSSNPWDGFIDEVKIFSYAKTGAQVLGDYNSKGGSDQASATFGSNDGETALSNGLIGYWKLNEGTGTSTSDSSGNNVTGTLTNSPSWTNSAKFGNAVSFDGSAGPNADVIDLGDQAAFELNTLTISGWIYRSGSCQFNTCPIFSKGMTNNLGYSLETVVSGSEKLRFTINDGSQTVTGATTITSNTWHHVAATMDGKNIRLYVNGILDADTAQFVTPNYGSETAKIGNRNDNAAVTFNGSIDDVRLYNRALSSREVRFLSDWAPMPVGYWKLDENTGTSVVLDSSGKQKDLAINTGVSSGGTITLEQSVMGNTTNGTSFTLTSWTPQPNELVLVAVGIRDETRTVTVSGNNLTFVEEVNLDNSQGQNGVHIFRAMGSSPTTGQITVSIAGNTLPVSAVASRFSGVDTSGSDGSGAYEAEATNAGPPVTDDNDMKVSIATLTNGAWAYAAGTHRNTTFTTPAGENTISINNPVGSGGDVTSISTWYESVPTATTVTVGDDNDLSGNNDWAVAATSIKPAPGVSKTAQWSQGKYGSSLALSGGGYLSRSDDADFDFSAGNSFTVEAWVKHNGEISASSDYILAKADGTNGGYKLYMDPSGDACFAIDDDSSWTPDDTACTSAIDYDDGKWHHFVGVKTGTSKIELYVDGNLVASDTSISATNTLANSGNLYIGVDSDGTSNPWEGSIDDVRIYNHARTNKQIISDMNGGHPSVGSPVGSATGSWSFDEGSGSTAYDKSINGNNLSSGGVVVSSMYTPSGVLHKAWNGNGANWLTRADDDDFDFNSSDDFTISTWFKSDSATNPANAQYILSKGTITNSGTAGYAMYVNTSGNIVFGIKDDASWGASSPNTVAPDDSVTSTADLYDGQWHHIVATKTGTSRIDLYIDGKLNASDTSISATGSLANSIALIVGDDDADSANALAGDLDELRIYRYSLNIDEVQVEFNQGKSQVMGALSTTSNGITADNSSEREFCVPGDTSFCTYPRGYWKLDEKTGTTVADSSTLNNSGTMTGMDASAWEKGKIGSAIHFDGVNDTLDMNDGNGVNNYLDFDDTTDFTLEAWIKNDTVSTEDAIISKKVTAQGTSDTGYTLMRWSDANGGNICLYISDGTDAWSMCTSNTVTVANEWTHIVAVFDQDSATNSNIYVNGIPRKTSTSGTIENVNSIANDVDFRVGSSGETTSVLDPFDGYIDEVKVYNYARTPAQIAWDYNRGAAAGWWKFDECTGATLYDSSGSNNHGTWGGNVSGVTSVGNCSTSSTARGNGATGKRNSSLSFDGSDDYVTIADNDYLDASSTDFSIAAWIFPDNFGDSSYGRIFDKYTSNTGYSFYLGNNPAGTPAGTNSICASIGSDSKCGNNNIINTGVWQHVAMTFNDTANTLTFYVNGNKQGADATITQQAASNAAAVIIGDNNDLNRSFDGLIDEVRFYRYQLTETQIKQVYNDGAVRFGPQTGSP